MGQLFQKIDGKDGRIEFNFQDLAAIHIFLNTKTLYVEIKRTQAMIKSKYTMIMLKLIEANDSEIEIQSISLHRRVQRVVLREGKGEELTTARFTQQVLNVASKRLV